MLPIRSQRGMLKRVADGLGITPASVSEWTRVPAERLPEVERITGIPRHVLRPDIVPPPAHRVRHRVSAQRAVLRPDIVPPPAHPSPTELL